MSFPTIIAIIVVVHFIVGIGYIVYKITTAKPSEELKDKKEE
ncbi:MAG: hypothetical protein U0V04_06350 [Spirosomataceae bacterium]|mgnify:CR=1 FL=1|jgi:Tfp pilus assembly protein PilO